MADDKHGDDKQRAGTQGDRTQGGGTQGDRTEVPHAPGKDLGPRGTRDVDDPPNTGEVPPSNDLSEDPVTPEPPG
jgi:hypothetical protein